MYVKAGENLQAAIDNAKEFQEIRVAGGAVFNGTIVFDAKNKNKSVSGGWNADFTEQSWDNLTVIDGGGVNRGFYCGDNPITDMPLQGSVATASASPVMVAPSACPVALSLCTTATSTTTRPTAVPSTPVRTTSLQTSLSTTASS